jgi:dipeptidyl aminopeptidase/acylaminoacyl peptidase
MKQCTTMAVLAAVVTCATAALAEPSGRHPLTVEGLWAVKRVADPQVSPDGRNVAFTVTAYDMEKNAGNSDVWLMPSGGGRPRQLTTSDTSDTSPRWLPDGTGLLFLSGRSGKTQVWLLPMDGGDARQITSLPAGASGFSVGAKGRHLLVTTDVFPDCTTLACTQERLDQQASSKVKARVTDTLLFRHWDTWREGMVSHLFVVPLDGGEPRDLIHGALDCPPIALGSSHDFVLSPDETEVAYVANTDKGVAWSTNNDVFLVPIAGGTAKRLTAGRGNDFGPRYSPDGRSLAYLSMERPGFEADRSRLVLYDRAANRHTVLTDRLDRSIDDFVWAPDSASIFFNAADAGRMPVWSVSVPRGRVSKVIEGSVNEGLAVLPNGRTLVLLRQTQSVPTEVFRADVDGANQVQLSHVNDELMSRIEMGAVEEFWYQGAGGDRVHSWLIRPPGFQQGRRYPLVVLIHGGPQGSWLDTFHYRWNTQMFAAPGYVVIAMDFHGSTGYGQDFTDAVSRDWGGAPYEDIMAGVDHAVSTYDFIDRERIGAAGASYGGFMINWILGHTDRFDCLISHAGLAEQWSMYGETEELWYPEWEFGGMPWEHPELFDRFSPMRYAGNFRTPTLVVHGEHDYRVPYTQGLQVFTALQRRGVPSRLLFFPDETHFVARPQNARLWWTEVHGWLRRFLGP